MRQKTAPNDLYGDIPLLYETDYLETLVDAALESAEEHLQEE